MRRSRVKPASTMQRLPFNAHPLCKLSVSYLKAVYGKHPVVPDPRYHGWITDNDGNIAIKWMQNPPAPDAVLDLLSCKCSRSCKLPSCTCLSNKLACTSMCKFQTCNNQKKQEKEMRVELGDSDSDSSEHGSDEKDLSTKSYPVT